MLQKSCGSTQRHGQLFVLEKMLQNQFPGAFEAQRCIRRNGRIPDPPGIVDVNVTQSETEVWHNLKAVISAEGAKFSTSPGRTYVQKINDLVQSQVHNRKNVDRSRSTTSCVYIGEHKGTITTAMFGTVVRKELSRIAWRGRMANLHFEKNDMQLAYCMTVHKAQGSEFSDVVSSSLSTYRLWPAYLIDDGSTRLLQGPKVAFVSFQPQFCFGRGNLQKLTNLNFKELKGR
jgi:hypothetical protein